MHTPSKNICKGELDPGQRAVERVFLGILLINKKIKQINTSLKMELAWPYTRPINDYVEW